MDDNMDVFLLLYFWSIDNILYHTEPILGVRSDLFYQHFDIVVSEQIRNMAKILKSLV